MLCIARLLEQVCSRPFLHTSAGKVTVSVLIQSCCKPVISLRRCPVRINSFTIVGNVPALRDAVFQTMASSLSDKTRSTRDCVGVGRDARPK
jgi:hypothetical protein